MIRPENGKLRLNITISAPGENPEDRTIGFTADGLASILENGNVISTVPHYNSDGDDLAIIEWPCETQEDCDYITEQLDADDRVLSYR